MKNTKILLGALALATLAGCPGPAATTDTGTDAGTPPTDTGPRDTGPGMTDTNPMTADMGVDANTPAPDCTTYCTAITANCMGANAQYPDVTTCMSTCMTAAWTAGTAMDTSGNTLGCRIYHANAAMSLMMPAVHCPHAGAYGGGQCSPFRTDSPVESTTATGYIRVDRMGMPAVATALIGPGQTTMAMVEAAKDAYNDSDPNGDASFVVSGSDLLTGLTALHRGLDADLVAHGLTPCSVDHNFPAFGRMVPACAVQQYDAPPGTAGHPVATLILPDTLRFDPAVSATFPNGRALPDRVIDVTLSVLLLNLSPCAGTPQGEECPSITTMATCAADTHCTWNATGAGSCLPAATSVTATCGAITTQAACMAPTCYWTGASCIPTPCEFLPVTAACPAVPGCAASTCGGATTACSAGTFASLPNVNPMGNDATPLPAFPYFADPH